MRIGIDLGGTKIEGLVLDGDGTERARLRVATPTGTYEDTVSAIVDLVAKLETHVGARPAELLLHRHDEQREGVVDQPPGDELAERQDPQDRRGTLAPGAGAAEAGDCRGVLALSVHVIEA